VCDRYAKYVLAGLIRDTGFEYGPGHELGQANAVTYATGLISWAVNSHQAV